MAKAKQITAIVALITPIQFEQIAGNATSETAVQTLNTFYLKRFISKLELNCSVSPNENGKQSWRCEFFIK